MAPLDGIRILDLSWYAPGPFCSLVCAALGAEVVKVEPLSGDPLRELDSEAFGRLNAGKKSLCLDLKRARGRERLFDLARGADVLLEGFRPGVAERLGIDYPAMRRIAPSLLYLSITGYGRTSRYRERAGHDINYMALAGALHGARAPLPLQVADFGSGGLYGVIGILAALVEKGRGGEGRHLDLSMHRGLLAMSQLTLGKAADRLSGRYANYTLYETRDGGGLSVGALEHKFWERFCRALGRPDAIERVDEPGLRDELAEAVVERDLVDWEARFEGVDACVEPVRSPRSARGHATSLYPVADVTSPWPFGAGAPVLGPAPGLGEHTDALLAEAGLSPEAIAALRDEGVC